MFLPKTKSKRQPTRRFATMSKGRSPRRPALWPSPDHGEASQHIGRPDFAQFSGDESRKSLAAALFVTFFAVACLGQSGFHPRHGRWARILTPTVAMLASACAGRVVRGPGLCRVKGVNQQTLVICFKCQQPAPTSLLGVGFGVGVVELV